MNLNTEILVPGLRIFISIGIGMSLNRPVDIFIWILMLLVFVDMENHSISNYREDAI